MDLQTSPYDVVRYPALAFAHTHPASLGAHAALLGAPFAPFEGARVLEIGCGEGVNLLSMALEAPNAEFLGVDLAENPIALAKAAAAACGLSNVRFEARDLRDLGPADGPFDYIVAHGVYAWVPPPIRAALMRAAGDLLSERGLALISYNVRPGAGPREALREMMLFETRGLTEQGERLQIARSMLSRLAESWSDDDAYQAALRLAAERLLERAPASLYHDELGDTYAPQLFTDVVSAARSVGLNYLCDASASFRPHPLAPAENLAPERAAAGQDWERFEQLADFRLLRTFRNSIFSRGGADRLFVPDRLRGLWASAPIAPADERVKAGETVFLAPGGRKISTDLPPLADWLFRLSEAAPGYVPADPAADSERMARSATALFTSGTLALRTFPVALARRAGDRPLASPLARHMATRGDSTVVTLCQGALTMQEERSRAFLALLDGSRDRAALVAAMGGPSEASAAETQAQVDAALLELGLHGVLLA